jgi:formylglycine-generating enzyme required for sulfatase activity
MLRQRGTVALAALGSLVLVIAMPGCGNRPGSSKPDAKARETGGGKTQAVRPEIAVDLGSGVKLAMVLIPAGEFLMGSPDSDEDAPDWEKPQHRVRITKPFYLGKYPVTQEQWQAVMGSNPSRIKGPKHPVEMVRWNDCQAFLRKLNAKAGGQAGKFALPTEAQWEYACRAGSTTQYSFGDEQSELGEYAWYAENSGGKTHPVGEKRPNPWGLYDMHGNVWVWCQGWYDDRYYANSPTDDPKGPSRGGLRVLRGGGWINPAEHCRSAWRSNLSPNLCNEILGFRVCRAAADK